MHVLAYLKLNPSPVYTTRSDQSVEDAVKLMTVQKNSASIVTEKDDRCGGPGGNKKDSDLCPCDDVDRLSHGRNRPGASN